MTHQLLDTQDIPIPDLSHLVIEDEIPVDNFQSEKQQRLLIDPLYSFRYFSAPFIAAANVGVFYAIQKNPIVPDVFLSLSVQMPTDWSQKRNRSYFVWEFGKVPEVVIEIVSNKVGEELSSKKEDYARIGVIYYAVFDPLRQIQKPEQMNGALLKVYGLTHGRYVELPEPFWLESINLGLTLWEGEFEGQLDIWLRWCDRNSMILPTGAERAIQAESRAAQAESKAAQLAERLRAMGIDPDGVPL
jgi:Uma2 family endonuclease